VVREPEGNEHRTEYDERNLPWRITRGLGSPEESTAQIDYDLNANRARLIDAEDNDGDGEPETTVITYDGFDRPIETTDALGNQALLTYDVASNAVRQRYLGHPAGAPEASNVMLADVNQLHDELDRVYQVDRALFLSEGFAPLRAVDLKDENSDDLVTERFEYDRDSRLTCMLEDDLEQQRTIYDGADRPIERIDHLGNRRLMNYDQNSNANETTSVELSPEDLVPEERFSTLYCLRPARPTRARH
jgi:YD repeat-containing protein